jgi:dTMP kinase
VTARFITLEGIEGVGKSTNLEFVRGLIIEAGHEVQVTREPGGTVMAERLRDIVLHHDDESVPALAELLIMFAGRCLHLENLIRPVLKSGTWVLCDRFTDATYAYQGGGRGQSLDRIETLEAWIQEGLQPDLTLLLDADPEIGLARAGARGEKDRFEREQLEFFARVRNAYLERAARYSDRMVIIDAGRPLEEVQSSITKHMQIIL